MKILLIRPPTKHIEGSAKPSASLPSGLLYIAAVLEKNYFAVDIYDAQVNVDMPIYRDSDGNIHMGDRWEDVEVEIRKRRPDLVGITCPFTAQLENAIKTAEITKKINKDTITVVGGNHPSAKPDDFFLKTEAIDIVCIGEGEYTMLDIAKKFRKKEDLKDIPGIVVRDGDRIKINQQRPYIQDLDALPFPSYHLLNLEDYFLLYKKGFSDRPIWPHSGFERAAPFITSRGCPFNCIFCSVHLHMGRKWRFHSAEYVLRHLEFLVSTYRIKHLHFEDDNLTLSIDRFKDILSGLLKRGINVTWDTPNGIRADRMTKEILGDCKKSGCIYLIFGIESGNQDVLNRIIGKGLDLKKVIQVASWCKEEHIDTEAFFVIGFPGETKQKMRDTIEYALILQKRYDITPTVFVATPLPGTRLERLCFEKGILKSALSSEELAKMTQGQFIKDADTFNTGEVQALLKMFYRQYKKNFIKNVLLFFLRYPQAFFRFILRLINEKKINKQIILNILQYKNCLLRNL